MTRRSFVLVALLFVVGISGLGVLVLAARPQSTLIPEPTVGA